ncbi:hypothetical protein RKD24_000910 [Streptomyces calvus]
MWCPWSSSISSVLRVSGEHRAQGPRAGGAQRGTGRVLRAVGDDQCPRAALQRGAHAVGERALVVDADGDGAQAERRDQVEQASPPGVLHRDRVPRFQVRHEHPLHGVQRARGHGEGPGRDAVGVQSGAGQALQRGLDGRVPVEHRLPVALSGRRREGSGQRGQQRRVRVALGQVHHTRRDLHTDEVPRGGGRFGPHAAAAAARGLDDPAFAQGPVRGRDGVRVHSEPVRQLPHGWQQFTRPQLAFRHRSLHTRGNLRCAPPTDRILS